VKDNNEKIFKKYFYNIIFRLFYYNLVHHHYKKPKSVHGDKPLIDTKIIIQEEKRYGQKSY
jgi:hypothetical protein